jgi:hypothetical protein
MMIHTKITSGASLMKMFSFMVMAALLILLVFALIPARSSMRRSTRGIVGLLVTDRPPASYATLQPSTTGPKMPNEEQTETRQNSEESCIGNVAGAVKIEEDLAVAPDQTISENKVGLVQNETQSTDGFFPDGRIFLGGEPPYGFIPTYTPKGPTGLPPIPIEPVE